MVPRGERTRVPEESAGKHQWLNFDEYRRIHESALEKARFVLDDSTTYERQIEGGETLGIVLAGRILCRAGIVIDMSKKAVIGVWALLAFLMSLNGVLRETVLANIFRRSIADALSAALGITIILGTTGAFFRAFPHWRNTNPVRLALVWAGLTVAFEFIFGHYVDRKNWSELAENYAIWRGKLWPLVLLSLLAAPFVWTRQRR